MYTHIPSPFIISSNTETVWLVGDRDLTDYELKQEHFKDIYAFLKLKTEHLIDDGYLWTDVDREETELLVRALTQLRQAIQKRGGE